MSFDDLSEVERLRQELKKITAERDQLLTENSALHQTAKGKQNLNQIEKKAPSLVKTLPTAAHPESTDLSAIKKEPNSVDKMQLYRSLFRGREDIYARFWQSQKTLKSGYSPVCKNEWNRDLCQKWKVKCEDLPSIL